MAAIASSMATLTSHLAGFTPGSGGGGARAAAVVPAPAVAPLANLPANMLGEIADALTDDATQVSDPAVVNLAHALKLANVWTMNMLLKLDSKEDLVRARCSSAPAYSAHFAPY
jgi:hypothetical protein